MRIILFLFLASLTFLISCTSEKESDLKPDCTASDLTISGLAITNASCSEPGNLTLTASGGEGQLSYSLGGAVFQPAPVFEGLSAGNYNAVVKDENECTADTIVTVAAEDGSIILTIDSKTTSGCGTTSGTVSVSATGGDGDFTFNVDGGSFGPSEEFTGLDQGQHTFGARDGEGCITTQSANVLSGVSLADQIMPIIDNNCAVSGCHADTEFPRFNSQSVVQDNAVAIKDITSRGSMPPPEEPDLTDEEIELIACWADDVAAGN